MSGSTPLSAVQADGYAAPVDEEAVAAILELIGLGSLTAAFGPSAGATALPFDATFALAELSNALSIRSDIVDALDENTVVELAQSSEARLAWTMHRGRPLLTLVERFQKAQLG